MKRILLIMLAACLAFGAKAQVRSVGVTVGPYDAVSFQHMVYGTPNVFQLDLGYHCGLQNSGSIRLMGSYNIMILSPKWTEEGKWNFYAGPGVYIGGGWGHRSGLTYGLMAIVGLEYLFDDIPLQLSVDMRPCIGRTLTKDEYVFDMNGLLSLSPTISARYLF